jgi:hypothetical protein
LDEQTYALQVTYQHQMELVKFIQDAVVDMLLQGFEILVGVHCFLE